MCSRFVEKFLPFAWWHRPLSSFVLPVLRYMRIPYFLSRQTEKSSIIVITQFAKRSVPPKIVYLSVYNVLRLQIIIPLCSRIPIFLTTFFANTSLPALSWATLLPPSFLHISTIKFVLFLFCHSLNMSRQYQLSVFDIFYYSAFYIYTVIYSVVGNSFNLRSACRSPWLLASLQIELPSHTLHSSSISCDDNSYFAYTFDTIPLLALVFDIPLQKWSCMPKISDPWSFFLVSVRTYFISYWYSVHSKYPDSEYFSVGCVIP